MGESRRVYQTLIDTMTEALDDRLHSIDVQQYLTPNEIRDARQRWIQEFNQHETVKYTAHQGSSEYLPFLLKHLPLMDLSDDDFHFSNLYDNALWAFHSREMYPWAKSLDEQIYREYVVPHAVVDEPRRGVWRHEFQWLIETKILNNLSLNLLSSTSKQIRRILVEINRTIWNIFGNGEIIYSPDLAPEIIAPKDVIDKKRASCTGLSLVVIYACRSVGIPARLAGVYNWNDGNRRSGLCATRCQTQKRTASSEALSDDKQPLCSALNNHSWIEVFDGERWVFTGAHEAPSDDTHALNNTWFYPEKTNLQIAGDPEFAIRSTTYSNHSQIFPLAWNPSYPGVYSIDVTHWYQKGLKDQ